MDVEVHPDVGRPAVVPGMSGVIGRLLVVVVWVGKAACVAAVAVRVLVEAGVL